MPRSSCKVLLLTYHGGFRLTGISSPNYPVETVNVQDYSDSCASEWVQTLIRLLVCASAAGDGKHSRLLSLLVIAPALPILTLGGLGGGGYTGFQFL
jgi:hypothetical protein